MERKNLLETRELSAYLGFTRKRIYYLVKEEAIPFIKIVQRIYFDREDIDRWLKQHKHPTGSDSGKEE